MRLSVVFELLLFFVLLAFAASMVIDSKALTTARKRPSNAVGKKKPGKEKQASNPYCVCAADLMCNCCREFEIPVLPQGPACASLVYLQGNNLMVGLSFGNRVLTNTTISGKKPKPVCMPLPGGVSLFCSRVYDIERDGGDFKACLSLELRSAGDLEAALRVSCFRFSPKGVTLEPPTPLPFSEDDENDDDDDDDDYGFGDDDDDDDDDEDDDGFGSFGTDFLSGIFGTSETKTKKKTKPDEGIFTTYNTPVPAPQKAVTSTQRPTKRPSVQPPKPPKPLKVGTFPSEVTTAKPPKTTRRPTKPNKVVPVITTAAPLKATTTTVKPVKRKPIVAAASDSDNEVDSGEDNTPLTNNAVEEEGDDDEDEEEDTEEEEEEEEEAEEEGEEEEEEEEDDNQEAQKEVTTTLAPATASESTFVPPEEEEEEEVAEEAEDEKTTVSTLASDDVTYERVPEIPRPSANPGEDDVFDQLADGIEEVADDAIEAVDDADEENEVEEDEKDEESSTDVSTTESDDDYTHQFDGTEVVTARSEFKEEKVKDDDDDDDDDDGILGFELGFNDDDDDDEDDEEERKVKTPPTRSSRTHRRMRFR